MSYGRITRAEIDRLTDSITFLVTRLTDMYIHKVYGTAENRGRCLTYEMPYGECAIPVRMGRRRCHNRREAFRWDGVLYVPEARHLFLIRTEKGHDHDHYETTVARVRRTIEFIRECSDNARREREGENMEFDLPWSMWKGFEEATRVFGVVGCVDCVHGNHKACVELADRHGLLRVVQRINPEGIRRRNEYDVLPGPSRRLLLLGVALPACDPDGPQLLVVPFEPATFTQQELDEAVDAFDDSQDGRCGPSSDEDNNEDKSS
jgi:hypothetical protein